MVASVDQSAQPAVRPDRAHAQAPLQPDRAEHHVVPVWRYVLVFGALLVLTFLTVLAANFDLGGVANEVVALGIAALKASLVVLFFMHVRYSTPLLRLVVAVGFVWFGMMVLFTMSDFASRGWRSTPPRQLLAPVEQAPPPVPADRPVLAPQPTRAAPGAGEEAPAGE